MDEDARSELETWASDEGRTMSNLVERIVNEALAKRNQPPSGLSKEDLIEQLTKFISLLMGEHPRDGVSYVLIGQTIGIDPEKLHELYLLIQECRTQLKEKAKQ